MGIISSIIGGIFSSRSNSISEQQLALQQEQYYQNLRDSYYSYMSDLEGLRGEVSESQTAINQAQEDIASNQYYLDRWSDEYDATMTSAIDSVYDTYLQQRQAYTASTVEAAETGRVGGSAAIVSNAQKRSLTELTGNDDASFGLGGTLGYSIRSAAQDLLAERQTAQTAISTGYQSIASYQDAIASLNESIASYTNTTDELYQKLKDRGLSV